MNRATAIALGLEYSNLTEALEGAIYTLTELSRREELPRWLRNRAASEADACQRTLDLDIKP
jgi:hypothetical protein